MMAKPGLPAGDMGCYHIDTPISSAGLGRPTINRPADVPYRPSCSSDERVEDSILSHNARRALAPVIIAVFAITCLTGASEALTLQRLAASIDLSGVAAAQRPLLTVPPASVSGAGLLQLTVPASIELIAPSTEVRIGIPSECDVTIEVADESGAPLFLAQAHMRAGWQKLGFSGRDEQGHLLSNGVYYYTVTADGTSRTARVTINR